MSKLNLLLLKLLIVVGYYVALQSSSFVEAVESVVVEDVDCCRLLCALESSTFVEAVKSVVQAVDCCRLLCALKSSCFVKTVESVVENVDCCRLHYVL